MVEWHCRHERPSVNCLGVARVMAVVAWNSTWQLWQRRGLESFSIFQGQTVYQGKAIVALKVYDCHTKELVFERRPPQVVYPPNSPRSTGEQQESDFRREYVHVLADQLARHFYPHDPHADLALDAAYIH